MAGSGKVRWRKVLRYTFGGALCLLAGINVLVGSAWYLSLSIAAGAIIIIVGQRRIFRPGVTRTADEIVCRFVPWYESNTYLLLVALPLLGVASFAAGYAPGYPVWLRFTGTLLLGVTPLMVYAAVRMRLRCILRITPSALTVRLARGDATEIRRERVESVTPKIVPNGVGGESLQVEIAYHTGDLSSDPTKTVLLGVQLSVQPINLLNALVAWKDGVYDNPSELLNRIERILRGRSMAGV